MKMIVGVLRGGTSSEYTISLKSGAAILSALPEESYTTRDILIDKSGIWYLRGMHADPTRALSQVDMVLNALHGGIGEDGTIQRILERMGIPYAGSRASSAGLSLNKVRAREILQEAGIPMPRAFAFNLRNQMGTHEMAEAVFSLLGPPYILKPPTEGSSRGIRHVQTISALPDAIGDALDEYGAVLVEEYLVGEHATMGIIENFRNELLYTLPPAHIDLPKGVWYFDPQAEGEARARHFVPSSFSFEIKKRMSDIAQKAHLALGLAHFSDADFVITRRGPYLLELNASPVLHEGASFPLMLEAVGSSVREFLEHSISLARQ
jgi:D-alanine-D-alanine ligase